MLDKKAMTIQCDNIHKRDLQGEHLAQIVTGRLEMQGAEDKQALNRW